MKELIKQVHLISLLVLAPLRRALEQKSSSFSMEIPVQSPVNTL